MRFNVNRLLALFVSLLIVTNVKISSSASFRWGCASWFYDLGTDENIM